MKAKNLKPIPKASLGRRCFTTKEAAAYIGIGTQTLYNALPLLSVRTHRWGRKYLFTLEQLDKIIDSLPTR